MVKVQSRKIGEKYEQFWIPLPKKICESLRMGKGDELEVFIESGGIVLRKTEKIEPKKKKPITIKSIMAQGKAEERKELIKDAFEKGEIEEDAYREFGEWGWV